MTQEANPAGPSAPIQHCSRAKPSLKRLMRSTEQPAEADGDGYGGIRARLDGMADYIGKIAGGILCLPGRDLLRRPEPASPVLAPGTSRPLQSGRSLLQSSRRGSWRSRSRDVRPLVLSVADVSPPTKETAVGSKHEARMEDQVCRSAAAGSKRPASHPSSLHSSGRTGSVPGAKYLRVTSAGAAEKPEEPDADRNEKADKVGLEGRVLHRAHHETRCDAEGHGGRQPEAAAALVD